VPVSYLPVELRVHYSTSLSNAYWNGVAALFGDGGRYWHPLTVLDVIAHEIAHGVTGKYSQLVYTGQTGGLNEAFSDISAKAMQYALREEVDWNIGAEVWKAKDMVLRCMDNPPCDGYAIDHVKDYVPELTVHQSSGIFNKVFYLISQTYNPIYVYDVFFVANMAKWGPTTDFAEAASLIMESLEDLKAGLHLPYDYRDMDTTVFANAFNEVGIQCTKGTSDEFSWTCSDGIADEEIVDDSGAENAENVGIAFALA